MTPARIFSASAGQKMLALTALFLLLVAITSVLSLRPYIGGNAFIGHADQANTANLARNIAEGRGAVVDTVWLHTNGGLAGHSVTHPEPYWSVSVAAIVALFFLVFEPGRLALAAPALAAVLIAAGLFAHWAWVATNRFWPAAMVMTGTACSPVLLGGIGGLSDNYLVAVIAASTTALVRGLTTLRWSWLLASGILFGLAVSFKPSALMLLGLWPTYVFFTGRWRLQREFGFFMLGAIISLAPYILYNHAAYGTWAPGGTGLVIEAAEIRHNLTTQRGLPIFDAHNQAFYNPAFDSSGLVPNFGQRVSIATERFAEFIDKGLRQGALLPWWYQFLAAAGILLVVFRWWQRPFANQPSAAILYPAFAAALFLAGFALATRVHFEARYWAFMPPLALILGATVLRTRAGPLIAAAISCIAAYQAAVWYKAFRWPETPAAYARVNERIPVGTVVYSANPWQFAYHTRLPAVMTPYTDDKRVLRDTARRYGVAYLVTIRRDSRHPSFKERPPEHWPDVFEPVFQDEELGIWRVIW